MLNNFGLFLLIATLITGSVVLVDNRYFKKKRVSASEKKPFLIDFSQTFFPIILIILLLMLVTYP